MIWAVVKRNRFILLFIAVLSPLMYHFLLERDREYLHSILVFLCVIACSLFFIFRYRRGMPNLLHLSIALDN